MKLSRLKKLLQDLEELNFVLPNGEKVPSHFHVTEIGAISKHFIDCGGTIRKESKINFQLWTAEDIDHRLQAEKLRDIIKLSEEKLDLQDQEIEVEYQAETIGRYGLSHNDGQFHLEPLQTDCLAPDRCGIPQEKPRLKLSDLTKPEASKACSPGSACC